MTATQTDRTARAQLAVALARIGDAVFLDGGYAGQESFASAAEILALAIAAGAAPGSQLVDLCCGTGGPALHVAAGTGCRIVGVDRSEGAVQYAAAAAASRGLAARSDFLAGDAATAPLAGGFDAVLCIETMLAFSAKRRLFSEMRRLLRRGGRVALTTEVGSPLSEAELRGLPADEGNWMLPAGEILALLPECGFTIIRVEDHTTQHAATAERLVAAFCDHRNQLCHDMGVEQYQRFLGVYVQWRKWLAMGRLRKLAIVAETSDAGA